jgi:hypothetical protein
MSSLLRAFACRDRAIMVCKVRHSKLLFPHFTGTVRCCNLFCTFFSLKRANDLWDRLCGEPTSQRQPRLLVKVTFFLLYAWGSKTLDRGRAQSARLLSSPIPGSPLPPMALEGRHWAGGGGGRPRGSRVPLPPPSGAPSSANRSGGARRSKSKRRTTARGRRRNLEVG